MRMSVRGRVDDSESKSERESPPHPPAHHPCGSGPTSEAMLCGEAFGL